MLYFINKNWKENINVYNEIYREKVRGVELYYLFEYR